MATFISTWSVENGDTVILPIAVGTTLNISVNWGDLGHPNNIENYNRTIDQTGSNRPSHQYAVDGTDRVPLTVTVTNALPGWSFNTPEGQANSRSLLVSIVSYGGLVIADGGSQFKDCIRLTSFPATGPSLELPAFCNGMFQGCVALDCDLNTLNVQNVTDMSFMFSGCTSFNGNLSTWDVRKVTDMTHMFGGVFEAIDLELELFRLIPGCVSFTGIDRIFTIPADNAVTNMVSMFSGCSSFNGDLSGWQVQNVTDMSIMFGEQVLAREGQEELFIPGCVAFTGEGIFRIPGNNEGETNAVTDMRFMFAGCTNFNGNLADWNVQNVTNMLGMFTGCVEFTGTGIVDGIEETRIFGIPGTNSVRNMVFMFNDCTHFNGNLSEWNVQNVTDMSVMFQGCMDFTGTGVDENGNEVPRIFGIPETNEVTNMTYMFNGCTNFNGNLANWNIQNVTDMSNMFQLCEAFTGTGVDENGNEVPRIFGIPETNEVKNMLSMFSGCIHFNGNIANWNVQNVTDMSFMFAACDDFKRDVSTWIMTSIQDNASAPSFTDEYIDQVKPLFASAYPNAWTFANNVTNTVIENIIPANSRDMYTMDGLSLRYALPPFISTWSVKHDDIVILPIAVGTAFNITVNWGDPDHPNNEIYTGPILVDGSNRPSHQYAVAGNERVPRTVTVTGELPGWSFSNDQTSKDLLVSIVEYGGLSLDNNRSQFKDCIRLTSFPAAGPSLELPADCQSMFKGCVLLDCNLNTLNTSAVTDMSFMFTGCTSFNGNLSTWDVRKVTDMSYMFGGLFEEIVGPELIPGCESFTGIDRIFTIPVDNEVTNMSNMFSGCSSFNGDLSGWHVQNVTDMSNMFGSKNLTREGQEPLFIPGCVAFTGEGIFRIPGNNEGETNEVTNMISMFAGCTNFNGNLADWNVQNVTEMTNMFLGCEAFTGTGEDDNGNEVTRIFGIPETNAVTDIRNMFAGCTNFNGNLSEWNVQNVTEMSYMFQLCQAFTGTGVDENGNEATRIFGIPGTNAVTDMRGMFQGCTHFNGNIANWNVQNVTDMSFMFAACDDFKRDVSTWIMTSIQNNASAPTFTNAYIAQVKPLFASAYPNAWTFANDVTNTVIENIIPGNSRDMYTMAGLSLRYALPPFISTWSVANNTVVLPISIGTYINIRVDWGDELNPLPVLYNLTVNNDTDRPSYPYTVVGQDPVIRTVNVTGELPGWSFENDQTSKDLLVSIVAYGGLVIADGGSQFKDCAILSGFPAAGPSLELPSDCQSMFQGCVLLDCNLNTLNTSAVTDMSFMFTGCTSFNGNLSTWDVRKVTHMTNMFGGVIVEEGLDGVIIPGCEAFTGINSIFTIPEDNEVTNMSFMFSGCSSFNGDLSQWNVQNVTNMTRMFGSQSAFEGCKNFNGNLADWNVQNVTNMSFMFQGCEEFTGTVTVNDIEAKRIFDIPETNSIQLMKGMFEDCKKFNGNLADWNVQNVTDMSFMFGDCQAFTGVGDNDATRIFGIPGNAAGESNKVTDMRGMFAGCTHFNGNLANWNVQKVTNMKSMFDGCQAFTGTGEDDNGNEETRIFGIPGTNAVTDMVSMFAGCFNFNGNIANWNVQNVTHMSDIFTGCIDFKRDVSTWVMTSIQNNGSAPSFTNEYIAQVDPKFSTDNPDAWKFNGPVNRNVINFILPINSRKLYYIDNDLRLRLATDGERRRSSSKFSQSVIMPSYKTVIMKSYL